MNNICQSCHVDELNNFYVITDNILLIINKHEAGALRHRQHVINSTFGGK